MNGFVNNSLFNMFNMFEYGFNNFNNRIYISLPRMSNSYINAFQHFKENYNTNATMSSHGYYINVLEDFRKSYGRFPTKEEFYMIFRNDCPCEYNTDDETFLMAADFFMKEQGEMTFALSCQILFLFRQFVMIEHRNPSTFQEFNTFLTRSFIADTNPNALFENDVIHRPVEKTKVDKIRECAICLLEEQNCALCQDDINKDQSCIKLDCGHFFHADDKDCCENGTIFKWFEINRTCPTCRKEII